MACLKRNFYSRDSVTVAKDLIGKVLVNGNRAGRIVETEAYKENDPASHSCNGMTPRSEVMFGEPGHAYVYLCYGMYWMFNVVTEKKGRAGAVLIRALEPVKNCGNTNGPGKLTKALGISKKHNGSDVVKGALHLEDGKAGKVVSATRIGIKKGIEKKWRFYEKGNSNVSVF